MCTILKISVAGPVGNVRVVHVSCLLMVVRDLWRDVDMSEKG